MAWFYVSCLALFSPPYPVSVFVFFRFIVSLLNIFIVWTEWEKLTLNEKKQLS